MSEEFPKNKSITGNNNNNDSETQSLSETEVEIEKKIIDWLSSEEDEFVEVGEDGIPTHIKEGLNLSEDIIKSVAEKIFLDRFWKGNIGGAIRVKEVFKLSDVISSPEVQSVVKDKLIEYLSTGQTFDAFQIKEAFKLPDSVISSSEVQSAAEKLLLRRFSTVGMSIGSDVIRIKKAFNLPEDIVQSTVKEGLVRNLLKGDTDSAIEIQKTLNLPEDFFFLAVFDKVPQIKDFVESLRADHPKLAKKFETDISTLFAYLEMNDEERENFISELKLFPFISQAVEENPRYGIKLALKLPELDELSRNNITFLYDVTVGRGDINADTPEFRGLVQKKLESYRNNSTILASLKEHGVNIDEWLNYDNETDFDLGKEEELLLSEKLKTPVFRIRESLGSYSSSLKNVLAEHRKEFSGTMVTEDIDEVTLQVEKLTREKEKALAEHNTKKAEGIDKGMAQLTKRIANPKNIPLWEKVLGDLSLIDRVTKDILSAYTVLIESETSLQNYSKDQSKSTKERREEVLKLKHKAENAKQEFVSKFKTLETRLGVFKEKLNKILTSTIGEKRANKLIGDWESAIAEGMNHFESDKTTVANIFGHEDGEQDKLDRTPMIIKVWSRNPDVDLYLGNYTDCCIRIDSEHMGEESTIADYLTDVGMQVLTVYDEKKKIPVVAAWTFVGVNEKGETALVIDNIEANTDYSTNYKTQLEEKLRTYFAEYTKSVGLKKFVQGQWNNDLVIAKMDGKYKKLGGYNREDGYFLEGEHSEDEDDNDNNEEDEDDDN